MLSLFEMDKDTKEKIRVFEETDTPLKFIYMKEGKYISIKSIIRDNSSLIKAYNEQRYYGDKISINDFLMAYYKSLKSPKKNEVLSKRIGDFIDQLKAKGVKKVPEKNHYDDDLLKYKKENWDTKWNTLLKESKEKIDKLKEFYDNLTKYGGKTSDETRKHIEDSISYDTVTYKMEIDKGTASPEYGIYIFNEMEASERVPFIHYIDSDEEYFYKVYNSTTSFVNNDLKTTKDCIYVIISLNKIPVEIKFDLELKELFFQIPSSLRGEKEYVKGMLNSLFKGISFHKESVENLRGSMEVPFPSYNETNFYALTMVDEIISQVLYVKEISNLRGLGNRNKFYFRNPSYIADTTTTVDHILSFNIEPSVTGMIRIIFKSRTDKLLDFGIVLQRFSNIYDSSEKDSKDYEDEEEDDDEPDIPSYTLYLLREFFKDENIEEIMDSEQESKLGALRARNPPNMFLRRLYSKSCGCKNQPIIVDEEDVDDWKNLPFDVKGKKVKKRNVMLFPPEDSKLGPKHYYTCPGDKFPYIVQKTSSWNESYPLLPCCAKTEQKGSRDFEKLRTEGLSTKTTGKLGHEAKTLKALPDKGVGEIPDSLSKFLNKAYPGMKLNFKRYGVPEKNLSFIHCVLRATNGLEKRGSYDDMAIKLRHDYYNSKLSNKIPLKIKKNLSKYVNLNCMAQELYDMSHNDIESLLDDENRYFDPFLFYRAMEVLFQVNIFTFVTDETQFFIPYLETPRYRSFHVRHINEKLPTVLLLKHKSIKGDDLTELILTKGLIEKNKSSFLSQGASLFDERMTKFMKEFSEQSSYNVIQDRTFRMNPYNKLNWLRILSDHKIVSQHLNDDGKAYAVDIKLKRKDGEKRNITMFIPPSQPFNVDVETKILYSRKDITREFFGKESRKGSEGLWYDINKFEKVFIPCKDIEEGSGKECRDYELEKNIDKDFEQLKELKRMRKESFILTQLVTWCWRCGGSGNIDTFFRENVKEVDEKYPEKLKIIPYTMKQQSGYKEAIRYLSKYWNIFNEDGKMRLYPELERHLNLFLKNLERRTEGLKNRPINYISGILKKSADFKTYPFNLVLIGAEELRKWLKFREKDENQFTVKNSIVSSDISTEPFFFKNTDGRVYIFQNSIKSDLMSSLIIAQTWKHKGENIGYSGLKGGKIRRQTENYDYVIYKQALEGGLTVIDTHLKDENSTDYLQIYEFSKGSYLAMLPLN